MKHLSYITTPKSYYDLLSYIGAGQSVLADETKVKSFDVLGVPVTVITPGGAAELIESWGRDNKGRYVCMRDVPSLMTIISDPALSDVHLEASMICPDGMPLAVIGRLKGHAVRRTCGPDLIDLVMARSPKSGLKHYLYGGKEGVAEKLSDVFKKKYPSVDIVGIECPPFRPLSEEEDAAAIGRIKKSGADVVWVGISSPKQEIWMRDHYKLLPQTLIGVGAAFDFHSGSVKRAPAWMQKSGLEFFHRLISEPRRLWRRYLILVPKFLWLVLTNRGA